MSKIEYCCGFAFAPDFTQLLLLKKQRPAWQRDKFNGVGGKIEEGETPLQAMIREFAEETGLGVTKWTPVAVLQGDEFRVHFFQAVCGYLGNAQALAGELPFVVPVRDLHNWPVLENLPLHVAIALDTTTEKPVYLRDSGIVAQSSPVRPEASAEAS